MTHENAHDARALTLAGKPRILQWIVLIVLTVVMVGILTRAHLPALYRVIYDYVSLCRINALFL